ncbi:MAG: DUF3179 domain-containing protein [Chloroflexi bacterium]|nr:DUF3179 domain-containing protein [Chloroflexota bacterium]
MYSTEINGEVMEFGTSGWLYQSNKLMYDRGTNTLWHQFLGEPVVGELAGSGIKLKVLPVTLTTWDEWVLAHPNTTVLHIQTGIYPTGNYLAEEHPASVYSNYRRSEATMFPVPERSSRLATKSRVLGLILNGQSRAYPEDVLTQEPVVNDSLGGVGLVVVTVGGGSRAYQAGGHNFIFAGDEGRRSGTKFLLDEDGERWEITEDALVGTGSPDERLDRLPSRSSYWFGWYAFHPATEVYQP